MAKVSLRFLILVVPYGWEYEAACRLRGLYVGKIRWKLLVWVRVGRVYLLRPSEKYRLLFGFSDDLQSSLHAGVLD